MFHVQIKADDNQRWGASVAFKGNYILQCPLQKKQEKPLQILKEKGIDPEIRNYMEEPPSQAELAEVLRKMGKRPRDIFRKSEPLYKDLGLKNKDLSDDDLLDYLHQYPILIERPIVVKGQRAVLGRPPEDVKKIL